MKKFYLVIILFSIACFGVFPFFSPGIPVTHDGIDHVARIANFYQSLSEGNIIPRWAGNLNWGYGYPILMFLYPLPSYIASLFHFFGFSYIDSVRLVFILAFLASGFFMFLWIQSFLDKASGILAAFLYMFAPYRFVDMYVRGALGEHMAFVFAPLLLYFVYKLSQNNNKKSMSFFASITFSCLILSHNAISLMFFPFVIFYMVFLIYQSSHKQQLIRSYVLILMLGFGFSAFFWIPAFFEGKYTHRDILTAGRYAESFSPMLRFFSSPWSFEGTGKLSVEIGKVQWFVVLSSFAATFFLFKNKKNFLGTLLLLCISVFWVSLFLMTSWSNVVWEKLTILQKFQFPWRFLTLSVFSTSVVGAICIQVVPQKIKIAVVAISIILLLFFNRDYIKANGYVNKPDAYFLDVYPGTTDTGESSPIWSVSYMKQIPDAHLAVIGGQAHVYQLQRLSTKHIYKVTAYTRSQLRENTLYFPGWNVLVDSKKIAIEYQARNNQGVMTFFIPKGEHIVSVEFSDTKLRKVANAISILTAITVIF